MVILSIETISIDVDMARYAAVQDKMGFLITTGHVGPSVYLMILYANINGSKHYRNC